MRQLLPIPADSVDPVAAYRGDDRPGTTRRPWLLLNMVTSLDGATAVHGESAGLSSRGDKIVFRALRSIADVILVGAGTWRAEGYRPPRTSEDDQAWRTRQGKPPFPRIAVVSGRLDLDPDTEFFTDTPTRPIVITTDTADRDRAARLAEVADLVVAGDTELDMTAALAALGRAGAEVVLCEGGPVLNESLLAASLVDELCLTLAPLLAGGTSQRAIAGAASVIPEQLHLDRALEDEGFLILRYTRPARP